MLDQKRIIELAEVEENLSYQFLDKDLLNNSLYHSSFTNENKKNLDPKEKNTYSNERLEFLGDAVIGLIVSDMLYKEEERYPEGKMTKLRSKLVSEGSFAYMARLLNLGKFLKMGKGEELSGGRNRDSTLADAFEAVIAAIYLDSGYNGTQIYFEEVLEEKLLGYLELAEGIDDYKTYLQEYYQKSGQALKYVINRETGPEHNKTFYVSVQDKNGVIAEGFGKSKKNAEQMAAKNAVKMLGIADGI